MRFPRDISKAEGAACACELTPDAGWRKLTLMLTPKSHDSQMAQIRLVLCEHELLPLAEGALWWPTQETLVVSDLHLEKGVSYARSGQYLPPYDTAATLARVARLIDQLGVARVISLGDSFHTPRSADALDPESCDLVRSLTSRCEWIWVEGNHDPDPPAHLGGQAAKTFRLGRLIFRHEPTGEAGEVAGHLHPCARLVGRGGKKVRRRCFLTNGGSLIMPAMGAFTGGLNVLDPAYAPVMAGDRQAFMLGADRVYAVPASRLVPDRADPGSVWRL